MHTITMVDFRRDAGSVLRALRRGERIVLTYRGRAVARLEPVRAEPPPGADDLVFRIHEQAADSPLGPLDHDAIDDVLYG